MESLNDKEREWFVAEYPHMAYFAEARMIVGTYSFRSRYRNLPIISDSYELTIRLNETSEFPSVYETAGKIKRMATILNLPLSGLHVNYDNTLCMIRPDKLQLYYPHGVNIKDFMKHLGTHLYWVSYRFQYGKEPWIAEKHGW